MPTVDATLAQESTGLAAGRMSKTAAYYLAFVALGLTSATLGPTLLDLAENTQTNLREISFLFTARSLGYLIGSFFGGRLYDSKPGHPVMALMLMGMAAMLTLIPITSILWVLTGVLLVLGMVEGALDVGGNTMLVWVHRHRVGPYMNGLHSFFSLGNTLAPAIVALVVLVSGGITWAYWLLAFLMLPAVLWLLRLPSPAAQTVSKDNPAGQVNFRLVVLIVLFFFFYVGAEIGFGGWISTYAVTMNLADKALAAIFAAVFGGAFMVGRLAAIPIALRVRPRYILLGDLIGSLVSLGILLLWPNSLLGLWAGIIGFGFAIASIFPTTISLAERRMTVTGQVMGWFFVGASAGAMFWPWLIGQLFESTGPQVMPLALFIDLLLALGILAVLIAASTRAVVKTEG